MAEETSDAQVVHALFMLKAHFVLEERAKGEVNLANTINQVQEALVDNGWSIMGVQENVEDGDICAIYEEHEGRDYYPGLINSVQTASIAFHVTKATVEPDATFNELRKEVVGPTDPEMARAVASPSLRAVYGTDCPHNAFHASDSVASGAREVEIVFGA